MPVRYFLFSILQKEQALGPLDAQTGLGQLVVSDVDPPVKWTSETPIGPETMTVTRLGVDPWKYTADNQGLVFASDDPKRNQEWYIMRPEEGADVAYISANREGTKLWTVVAPKEPIQIKECSGPPNISQLFRFARVYEN